MTVEQLSMEAQLGLGSNGKELVEIDIPQNFDFIEWAERITKLVKTKSVDIRFKDRPRELWGSDPSIPQTKEHFEEMLHHLSKYDDITCDVETSGLSYVDPNVRICGHVFTAGGDSFYVPVRHNTNEYQLDVGMVTQVLGSEVYGRPDATLNFHNASFDYNQLLKDGIDLSFRFKEQSIIDTQIMYWLLDENQKDDPYYYLLNPGRPATRTPYRSGFNGHLQKAKELGAVQLNGFSLKSLAPKLVGTPMTKFDTLMEHFGFQNLPIHFGGAYAKVDGDATHAIKQAGLPQLEAEKLDKAFWKVEMPFVQVNANMQRRGMGVNMSAVDRLQVRVNAELERLTGELFSVTGPIKFSGKQLSRLFHDEYGLPVLAKTDKGNPQFNDKAMDLYEEYLKEHNEQFGDKSEIPSKIIQIKKLEKIKGTYIEGNKGLLPNIDVDGRVHCSLYQTGTVTGRLSSGNPNLQNLPVAPVFVDELNREEMIKMRNEIGDLEINKRFDFSVLFKDEEGENLGIFPGWEEQCVKVVESWGFRDVFSEKGYTPEMRENHKEKYPRFGEMDAYVKPTSYGFGEMQVLDLVEINESDSEALYTVGDFSQMELVMMAHLANATSMIEAYEQGVDVHKKTASDVFQVPLDEVKKGERQLAKAVNFGLIYGKSDFGFATDWYSREPDFLVPSKWHPSGMEPAKKYLEQARGFIERYFEAYPDVKDYMDNRQLSAATNGYVRSITGRKRRLPEIFSENNSVKNRAKRQSVNSVVQGSSADYLKIAMVRLERDTEKLIEEGFQFFQLMTVHDEIITWTRRQDIDRAMEILVEGMTQTLKLRCPLGTDPSAAYTYGSAK